MQDMSLSQTAEFGFLKLAKAFEWTWQERKDPKSGETLGQAGSHLFVRIFMLFFDTTIMLGL